MMTLDLHAEIKFSKHGDEEFHTIIVRETGWFTQGSSLEEAIADAPDMIIRNIDVQRRLGGDFDGYLSRLLGCDRKDIPSAACFCLHLPTTTPAAPTVVALSLQLF